MQNRTVVLNCSAVVCQVREHEHNIEQDIILVLTTFSVHVILDCFALKVVIEIHDNNSSKCD